MRRGRALLLTLLVTLAGTEVLGLCAGGLAYGDFSPAQAAGFVLALGGVALLASGDTFVRLILGSGMLLLAAYGAYHLLFTQHEVSFHVVSLALHTAVRTFAGATIVFSRSVTAYLRTIARRGRSR